MMIVSIVAVTVLVPMGFIFAGHFSRWLESRGVHLSPNISGGYPIAEFTQFHRALENAPPGMDSADVRQALALTRFSVRKVAFRRFSGMGIAPRVNLCFEFDGKLPDPQNSPSHFSATTIHVYLKTPDGTANPATSSRAARVDFEGSGWTHEVVIDGFHDQALIYDNRGSLAARGLGLYVDYKDVPQKGSGDGLRTSSSRTTITAALPMQYLGDPARGEWKYYVLVGLTDSRDPSMMLHLAADAPPSAFCAPLAAGRPAAAGERPRLRPLAVKNPI